MEQAFAESIDRNLDLAAERLGIDVAEARQITARLRPNPVLTVSAQTLNVFGVDFSSNSPLGPNAVTAHTDFALLKFCDRSRFPGCKVDELRDFLHVEASNQGQHAFRELSGISDSKVFTTAN